MRVAIDSAGVDSSGEYVNIGGAKEVALNASLSTSAFELDRPLAGKELNIWLSTGRGEEAAAFAEL